MLLCGFKREGAALWMVVKKILKPSCEKVKMRNSTYSVRTTLCERQNGGEEYIFVLVYSRKILDHLPRYEQGG